MIAQKKLDIFIAEVERVALCVEDHTERQQSYYRDSRFDFKYRYVTFCSAGIKTEGMPTKLFKTAEEAVDKFCCKLYRILAVSLFEYRIVWRKRPEIIGNEIEGYTVRCRVQTV